MMSHDHKRSVMPVLLRYLRESNITGPTRTILLSFSHSSCQWNLPCCPAFITSKNSLSLPSVSLISPLPLRVLLAPLFHFICFFPSRVPSPFPYFSFPRSLYLIVPLPSRHALSPSITLSAVYFTLFLPLSLLFLSLSPSHLLPLLLFPLPNCCISYS